MKSLKRSKCLCLLRHFKNEQTSEYIKIQPLKDTNVLERSKKRTHWQRLKVVLFPYLIRSKELAVAYAEAKVEKELSEALKIAEEAAEVAAKKDLIRQKSAKEFCTVIDSIFADDGLLPGTKALKLAKLMEENPGIVVQLKKAEEVIQEFSLNKSNEGKLLEESKSHSIGNSILQIK